MEGRGWEELSESEKWARAGLQGFRAWANGQLNHALAAMEHTERDPQVVQEALSLMASELASVAGQVRSAMLAPSGEEGLVDLKETEAVAARALDVELAGWLEGVVGPAVLVVARLAESVVGEAEAVAVGVRLRESVASSLRLAADDLAPRGRGVA